ncbi:cyclic lactone autoinducer peptide [Hathewaya massiliensis]|nr:cyclic lactone autoinducer peptide [Hathewaya massiliensis]
MFKKFLEFTKALFDSIAFSNAKAACNYIAYQPKMPKDLED